MSWFEQYDNFNRMTISELKELLKAKDLPVSGKKRDLVSYLILSDYSELRPPLFVDKGEWLEQRFLNGPVSHAAINYQDIYSKVA